MYGMWHFYSAPYKPWSEGKNVYFLVGSFLLLITPATGHLVASFLQKSVSVLASGEALQDHVCSMEERCWGPDAHAAGVLLQILAAYFEHPWVH